MFGVPEIDKQHQILVNMLNSLNDAVKNNESREDIYRLIDDVISYIRFHFANEERLMVEYGYPEIETHKHKHKELIQEALHFRKKLDDVGEHQFMEWFNHWPFAHIIAHIKYADKQIEDYITQRGVKE